MTIGGHDVDTTKPSGVLLPLLRDFSSEGMYPELPLIPDVLFTRLAWVTITPEGRIRMVHVSHNMLGDRSLTELYSEAYQNLEEGLQIRASDPLPGGGRLGVVEREGYLGASAITLPDFHSRMSEVLEAEELVVGLACEDHLYLATNSSVGRKHIDIVLAQHGRCSADITPMALLLDANGLRKA